LCSQNRSESEVRRFSEVFFFMALSFARVNAARANDADDFSALDEAHRSSTPSRLTDDRLLAEVRYSVGWWQTDRATGT
jgi:hypothetical protein